jgi:aminoglycoside 6'-N-acetyltransferase
VAAHARRQDPATIGKRIGCVQCVIERDEGDGAWRFVGDFGVQTREPLPTVELGIVLAPTAKRQGIATLASRHLIDALFASRIHRIVARVDPRNEPSLRLFDRLGFRREGHERSGYWDDVYQEWTDEVLFAVLRSEWLASRQPGSNTNG